MYINSVKYSLSQMFLFLLCSIQLFQLSYLERSIKTMHLCICCVAFVMKTSMQKAFIFHLFFELYMCSLYIINPFLCTHLSRSISIPLLSSFLIAFGLLESFYKASDVLYNVYTCILHITSKCI